MFLVAYIPPRNTRSAFHFMFGYIHPFYGDSGRTNRYISNLFYNVAASNTLFRGIEMAGQERVVEDPNWRKIATLIRDHLDELALSSRERYRRDYKYSSNSHLPDESALR